jgi:hypothetical protein
MTCQDYVSLVESLKGADHCKNNEGELRRAIDFVACCRQMGRSDLAEMLLSQIEAKPLGKLKPISLLVSEQKTLLRQPKSVPNVMVLGWNFSSAMVRWAGSGFKMRTEKEISKRLKICQGCPELDNNMCKQCGCPCVEENQVMNKLALASETCPLGKWK